MIQLKLPLTIITSSMAANKDKKRKRAMVVFSIYMVLLIYFLFFAQEMGRTADKQYRYNLVLFFEIRRFIRNIDYLGWKSVIINVLGNVVAFMPFGYYVPKIIKKKLGILYTTILSFEFSLIVEFVQLVTKLGCFDVDDLMLNTIGGFLGYLCFYLIDRRQQESVNKKKT